MHINISDEFINFLYINMNFSKGLVSCLPWETIQKINLNIIFGNKILPKKKILEYLKIKINNYNTVRPTRNKSSCNKIIDLAKSEVLFGA